jgi:hypothetical protein
MQKTTKKRKEKENPTNHSWNVEERPRLDCGPYRPRRKYQDHQRSQDHAARADALFSGIRVAGGSDGHPASLGSCWFLE